MPPHGKKIVTDIEEAKRLKTLRSRATHCWPLSPSNPANHLPTSLSFITAIRRKPSNSSFTPVQSYELPAKRPAKPPKPAPFFFPKVHPVTNNHLLAPRINLQQKRSEGEGCVADQHDPRTVSRAIKYLRRRIPRQPAHEFSQRQPAVGPRAIGFSRSQRRSIKVASLGIRSEAIFYNEKLVIFRAHMP